MKKSKQSSPLKDELGINDFIAAATKPKKEDTYNIDLDSQEVKNGVGSLFTIIGQSFQAVAQLQKVAMEIDNGS